jgi:hypothetical protein
MADDEGLVLFEVLALGVDVGNVFVQLVIIDALGLLALVVAALVDGHDLEMLGQGRHLVAPGVPEIGKPVNHYDKRTLPQARVMNLYPVRIGIAVSHLGLDIARRKNGR